MGYGGEREKAEMDSKPQNPHCTTLLCRGSMWQEEDRVALAVGDVGIVKLIVTYDTATQGEEGRSFHSQEGPHHSMTKAELPSLYFLLSPCIDINKSYCGSQLDILL